MKALLVKEKELHDQIKLLEKEVSAHKKEIKTRDVSIGEKEKRIYELKKKNQVRCFRNFYISITPPIRILTWP